MCINRREWREIAKSSGTPCWTNSFHSFEEYKIMRAKGSLLLNWIASITFVSRPAPMRCPGDAMLSIYINRKWPSCCQIWLSLLRSKPHRESHDLSLIFRPKSSAITPKSDRLCFDLALLGMSAIRPITLAIFSRGSLQFQNPLFFSREPWN